MKNKFYLFISFFLMVCEPALAAGGVNKSTGGLMELQTWFGVILPIICTIGIAISGLLYSKGIIGKNALWNVFVGLMVAGCASWLASIFF